MTQSNQPSYGTEADGGTPGTSADRRSPDGGVLPGRDAAGPAERRDLAPERAAPDGPARGEAESARHEAHAAQEPARGARDEARQTVEQGRQAARQTAEQGKQVARDIAQQAGEKTREIAGRVREQGRDFVDQQRHRAADQLCTFGQAARDAARRLHEEKDHNVADYVEAAADQVERAGRYLEQRDLSGLLRDTQDLARRRPEWFIGGMFIAGVALARFVKSSSAHPDEMRAMPRYGSAGAPTYGAMAGESGTAGMAASATAAGGTSPQPPEHALPTPDTSTVAPEAAWNDPVAFPGTASSVTGPASVSAGPSAPPTAAAPASSAPLPQSAPSSTPPPPAPPSPDLTRED